MNTNIASAVISGGNRGARGAGIALLLVGAALWTTEVRAQLLAMTSDGSTGLIVQGTIYAHDAPAPADVTTDVPAVLRRQELNYSTTEPPGTIIVDTPNTYLYFVLGGGKAIRYGIGVGRDGFTWSGAKTIERKSEWPDWLPPADMLQRQPYLSRFMAGGPGNPLGARAMYLSGTVYRIHGTNNPSSIGKHVSSGCIRMLNEDVVDLYGRTNVGTRVVVLPMNNHHIALAQTAPKSIAPKRGGLFEPTFR